MSDASSEALFRQAAEAEGGMPVSAGARVAHVRAATTCTVDLSAVPEDQRPALVARINELVRQASAAAAAPAPGAPVPGT
jgi:hypothetical protein